MSVRRNPRLGSFLHRRNRSLRLEPLESRTLLSATATDESFRLVIFAESTEVEIPAEVGVQSDDSTESMFTIDDSGEIYLDSSDNLTLGDFFDIWQNNAGLAGNNTDAVLSEDQLLSYVEQGESTVQLFVNGEVSTELADYAVQDGDEIVLVYGDNPVLSLNTNYGPIVIELFEADTPGTVENFLNYVNDGDYDYSFFHRLDADFVLQGGGYTTPSTTFTAVTQFDDVAADDAITNEPGISNLRGTIAMAKLSGDANSATSQFFVNLSDDNAFLDTEDYGEFTVFGQVLDMTTIDEIAALTVDTANDSPFAELPLGEDTDGDATQLVVITSIAGQGEISGVKYLDADGDGQHDNDEELLAGITVYLDADDDGVLDSGEIWTVTGTDGSYFFQVEEGTYVVRAEVSVGATATSPLDPESYTVAVAIGTETTGLDFGEVELSAPTGVDLVADYDTGSADDDNLTGHNNADSTSVLRFLVTGVTAGADVQIYAGSTLIGSQVASGDTVTVTTDGSEVLNDGTYNITAVQVLGATTDPSDALVLTIDTAAPSELTNEAPETAQVGVAYSFDAESEEEGDVVYSLDDAPDGMSIEASTGEITWTPGSDQAVPQSFSIVLTDDAGNTTAEAVSITVLGSIPAYPDAYTVTEDSTLTVDAANGVLANDDTESGTLAVAVYDLPSHGTVTLGSNGSFTYTPTANFSGTDTFSYQATNTTGEESNVALVTITVVEANDAPIGVDDSYTLAEDTTLTKTASTGVLANDTDPDDNDLSVTLVDQAAHGTVTLASDGSFSYVPAANYVGTDSFTYTVSDGALQSSEITVSLTVTIANDAPTAVADSYSVDEDGTLAVTADDGVLANDSDVDDDSLTATIIAEPANGEITFDGDGSFVYTPDDDFNGTDKFTYRATDGVDTSSTTTVTITVGAVADAPSATDDTAEAPNDGTSIEIDVLDNDSSDPDDDQMLTITSVTQGSLGGTVTTDDNQITYTAAEGTVGEETFTYTITNTDGLTATATVTVAVSDSGDNTLCGYVYIDRDGDGTFDDGETGIPGVLVTLTGTDNFGNSASQTALTSDDGYYCFNGLRSGTYQLAERQPTAFSDGTDSSGVSGAEIDDDMISELAISDSDEFGDNNFAETELSIQYVSIRMFLASSSLAEYLRGVVADAEESDGNSDLAEAIRDGDTSYDGSDNDSPVADDDSYSGNEDTTLTVTATSGVLANDSDADDDSLTATLVSDASHGTLTLSSDGSFTYVPDDDYTGTDTFTYTVNDGMADSETATVTITVAVVNDVPVAEDDSYAVAEDGSLAISAASGVLANDSDEDDDSLTATLVSDASNGTLTLDSDGSFAYAPDSGFSGTDTFTYIASDGTSSSETATVTIVVNAVPVAVDDAYSVDEDGTLTIGSSSGVLENDSDADGDSLSVAIVDEPSHGSVTLSTSGAFVYVPDDEFSGTDTFTYIASDGTHESTEATVTITVSTVNDAPVAEDDSYTVPGNGTLTIAAGDGVLANDTDGEDDSLTATIVTEPSYGTVTLTTSGAFVYVPNDDFYGTDTFTYVASDGTDDSEVATVTITVYSVPVAYADSYSLEEDLPLTIDAESGVAANDVDADGGTLTVTVVDSPSHGTLALDSDGSFTYTPEDDYYGTDTFTYTASDGTDQSNEVTVTLTINSVNDAPAAATESYTVATNGLLAVAAEFGVLANDGDTENDAITAVIVTQPASGTLTLNGDGSFSYTPDTDFHGTDSFVYVANDGTSDSAETTVTVVVNTPVSTVADSYSVSRNSTLEVETASGVAVNDGDLDGDAFTVSVVTQPVNGTLTLNSDGSFTYVPDTSFYGIDTFTYVASDGFADSLETAVTIDVNVVASVVADAYSVAEDASLIVDAAEGVLSNDSDTDDTSLSVSVVADPYHGVLVLNTDGSFTYTPNADYNGTDTFTYLANDGSADSEVATVTITVAAANDAAVAVDDRYSVAVNGELTVSSATGVLLNDEDIDGDLLTVTLVDTTTSGTLSLSADGSFSYTPTADFHGIDTFTYTAGDGTEDSAVAMVTIYINTTPNAVSDPYSVEEDTELTVDVAAGVLSNDSDDDGDSLTVTLVLAPSYGTLTLNSDGSFTYQPGADFSGSDAFTYAASDGYGDSGEATVVISVDSVNDSPQVMGEIYDAVLNSVLTVDTESGLLANDSDADNDSLTVTLVAGPAHGTLLVNTDGSFSYTPETDYTGPDSFTYAVNDGTVDSAIATVTLDVAAADEVFADEEEWI